MGERKHCTLICILGGDLVEKGAKLGRRTITSDEYGVIFAHELIAKGREIRFVLSAGRADIHGKSNKYPDQPASMAVMMKQHLASELEVDPGIVLIPREVWGIKAELETLNNAAVQMMIDGYEIDEVIIVAASWLTRRVKMNIARIELERVVIVTFPDKANKKDLAIESVKALAEWMRINIPGFGSALRWIRGRD